MTSQHKGRASPGFDKRKQGGQSDTRQRAEVGAKPGRVAPAAPLASQARITPWSEAEWLAALPPLLASMDLVLSEAQCRKLASYMVMLAHWNGTFNLTAVREPREMLSHHLADCLAVLPPLARHLAQRAGPGAMSEAALLDVGSGGGLPGVVLAIARPDVQVTCVDTVGKKAAFIRQVTAELRLPNLRAEHARVEQLGGQFDVVCSRAFASLVDFVTLTKALLKPQGVWLAMKGKTPDEEIAALPPELKVFHVEQLQVPTLDAERCIVWMRTDDSSPEK